MSIEIRKAGQQDAGVITVLIQELADSIHEKSPVTEEYTRDYLTSPASGVYLAIEGGETQGLISYSLRENLYHAGPTCLIEELIVRANVRDKGIGSLLLEAILSDMKDLHCAEISISTMQGNEGAIRFYRRHGFVDEALLLEQHLY